MKQFLIFVFLTWGCGLLHAQKEVPRSIRLSAQVFDFVDPGFRVGYQFPLKSWTKTRKKGKRRKVNEKFLLAGLQLGYYHEIYSHHGLTIASLLTHRRVKPQKGNFFEINLGMGFQRSIYDARVFTVGENNEIRQDGSPGQDAFYSSVSFVWGRDLRYRKQVPLAWSIGIGIASRYPVNKTTIPMPYLETGLTYFFKPKKVDQ